MSTYTNQDVLYAIEDTTQDLKEDVELLSEDVLSLKTLIRESMLELEKTLAEQALRQSNMMDMMVRLSALLPANQRNKSLKEKPSRALPLRQCKTIIGI